ncbi:MAG: hypothetical protein N2112_06045 [Gemmataceae bacterium]|jgi:hypothetical protein|nr:hypothetical protein [Gemmataceae bacterium]
MKKLVSQKLVWGMLLSLGMWSLVGCEAKTESHKTGKEKSPAPSAVSKGHTHGEWWCDEHGVKEAECSMCDAKVAKAFQDKGDWCKEHARAKSQCFICDPKLQAKYAAEYKAKYGKEPPEPEGQKPEKK